MMNITKLGIMIGVCLGIVSFQGLAQTPDAATASSAAVPRADKDGLLKKVAAAINPDAEGDRTERFRMGLAALADLNQAGTTPEQALAQAKTSGSLSGSKVEKASTMLMEMWTLNVDRMSEPATLDALRNGKMPSPGLKRP
jgi:hypothetical protein